MYHLCIMNNKITSILILSGGLFLTFLLLFIVFYNEEVYKCQIASSLQKSILTNSLLLHCIFIVFPLLLYCYFAAYLNNKKMENTLYGT